MISKVVLSAFVALLVAQVALADPELCPEPSEAKQLVYKQNVHEDAPLFGRTEKDYVIPPLEKTVSCIILSGSATGSIASVGFSDEGIKVRLVSEIKKGFDAVIEVYTKEE
ncbi:uncharacterized protein LOC108912523 [Anoplophora glabripennis]|uniref:uncharacterized protein LOC108912523 n=1 Tax=Anoplophora glabripennis TaxID=217634 RepID=UPI00087570CD|nr:uncharacterized protein LOC108912523 [Anoplophora glabripennis]